MTNNTGIPTVNTEYVTYPAGRYEQYESKIRKISNVISFIRRHKVIISIALVAAVAAVISFTFCIGIFTKDIQCGDYTYGENLTVSASAFLSKIRYEYAEIGSDSWSSTPPLLPGEYSVRGVSENPFGKKRYSNTASFVLSPRDAQILISDASCEYGSLNDDFINQIIHLTGFAEGDRLEDVKFTTESESWEEVKATVSEFRIINADGADVTSSYNITKNDGIITVIPRKITVSTHSEEKTYDAVPVDKPQWSLSYGSLAEGDQLQIFYKTLPVNAGRYSAVPDDYKITDTSGEDITYKYDLQFECGTVTIHPRPLSFSTGSAEKVYDGKTLTCPEWALTKGTLVEGHKLSAEAVGTRAIVGESKNVLSVAITDGNGNYFTDNYSINVDTGTLTVTPIVLTFTTDSAQKVYDGKLLQAPGYKLISGKLLPGHRLEGEANGMLIDVGEKDNTLLVMIYNENNVNVTNAGYEIVVEYGTLKITPRPITITSSSAQKLYDGTALTAHSFSVPDNSLVNGDVVNPKFTGSQTEVGESPNYFTAMILNGGRDCSRNYDITLNFGTLKVLHNENFDPNNNPGGNGGGDSDIIITPGNGGGGEEPGGSQNGDGTDYSIFGVGGAAGIGFPPTDAPEIIYARVKLTGYGAYPFNAFLRATSYGDYNGSGFDAARDYTKSHISPLDFIGRSLPGSSNQLWTLHVERLSGCPVIIPYYSYDSTMFGTSDSYFLSGMNEYDYKFVKLTDDITGMRQYTRNIVTGEEWDYTQYVYEEYLQIPEYTRSELLRIGEENGIYDKGDKFLLADAIRKYVQNAGRYNLYGEQYPSGVDVAVYFLDVVKEGVCQHFAAAATMMYRAYGIPARYVTGFSVNLEPETTVSLSTYDRHAWVEIYFDSLGWIPVEVTGSGFGAAGTKTEIGIKAYSATKEYDGKIFSEWNSNKIVVTNGQLLPGHTMKVQLNEGRYHTTPGVYANEIASVKIYDSNGEDVTNKYYKLSYKDGEMTIKKRAIVIQLGSASKKYDGTPLKCEEWRLVSGTILPNTEIRVETISEITEVGTAVNQILHVYVYETKNGITKDVSSCYDIKALAGTLEITE